jgi:hypothetical protein
MACFAANYFSSTIIGHLNRHCSNRPKHAVTYFFFDFNDAAKQEVSYCVSSITAQLCSQTNVIPAQLTQLYKHCNYGMKQPNLSELKEILFNVIKNLEQVFIVIDALDECPKNGEREDLLGMILDLKSRSLPNLHVFASSRREPDIEEALVPLLTIPAIPVEGSQVNADIRLHIASQLPIYSKLNKWPEEVQADIEESLAAGANGM